MTSPDKPPYAVPSMAEIAAVPWNGLNVISTFSGCGGSSLGYRMAGFKVLWANEFIAAARDTYAANAPDTLLDSRDIRSVSPQSILDAIGMKRGELDLLDGSPPCASFSTAGKLARDWGKVKSYSDTSQQTDDLFFEFVRILDGLQPRAFVAENVSGLVKGVAKGYFLEILTAMKACGYTVKVKLLDSRWLGVPQRRQRLIFIGMRNDLELEPTHPKPLTYFYSVRDALPWISGFETVASSDGWDGPVTIRNASDAAYTTVGATASSGNGRATKVIHNTGGALRQFNMAELRRVCGFPDDFILTGSYAQQWERLGRAVPPVMMSHIAKPVAEVLYGDS
jgi:DNA (cytosine-5)-methyltransferase 1